MKTTLFSMLILSFCATGFAASGPFQQSFVVAQDANHASGFRIAAAKYEKSYPVVVGEWGSCDANDSLISCHAKREDHELVPGIRG